MTKICKTAGLSHFCIEKSVKVTEGKASKRVAFFLFLWFDCRSVKICKRLGLCQFCLGLSKCVRSAGLSFCTPWLSWTKYFKLICFARQLIKTFKVLTIARPFGKENSCEVKLKTCLNSSLRSEVNSAARSSLAKKQQPSPDVHFLRQSPVM